VNIPKHAQALSHGQLAPGAGTPHGAEMIIYPAGVDGKPYHAKRSKVRMLPGGLLTDGTILGTEKIAWLPGFFAEVTFGPTKKQKAGGRRR
jgi:hypothetical protein